MQRIQYVEILRFLFICIQPVVIVTSIFSQEVSTVKFSEDRIEDLKPSDYNSLRKQFENKDIVILGELTHMDGHTFSLYTELIKYLHDSLDFNLLLIEHMPQECALFFDDCIRGEDSLIYYYSWLNNHLGLSNSVYEEELIEYLETEIQSRDTLFFGGIDIGSVSVYNNLFTEKIGELVKSHSMLDDTESKFYLYTLGSLRPNKGLNQKSDGEKFLELNNRVIETLDSLGASSDQITNKRQFSLYNQSLKSIAYQVVWQNSERSTKKHKGFLTAEYSSLRDSFMYLNAKWYMDDYFPGLKTIVWTSGYHASRNTEGIKGQSKFWGNATPFGHFLFNEYQNRLASFITIYNQGWIGYNQSRCEKVKKRSKKSLESILNSKQLKLAFVDSEEWNGTIHFGQMGKVSANWSNCYEGFFYINEMMPDSIKYYPHRAGLKQPY
jgi:erythromycin esterase